MLLKKTTPAPQNIVLTVINEKKYLQAKFHARYVPFISSTCGIARLVTTFYARHVWKKYDYETGNVCADSYYRE